MANPLKTRAAYVAAQMQLWNESTRPAGTLPLGKGAYRPETLEGGTAVNAALRERTSTELRKLVPIKIADRMIVNNPGQYDSATVARACRDVGAAERLRTEQLAAAGVLAETGLIIDQAAANYDTEQGDQ